MPRCPKYNQGRLFVLFLDILNCLMDSLRFDKWNLDNSLHPMDILHIFTVDRSLSLQISILPPVTKILSEKKLSLPGKLYSNFIVVNKTVLLVRHFNKSVLFGWFSHFDCAYDFQPSDSVKHTNCMKTQLANLL